MLVLFCVLLVLAAVCFLAAAFGGSLHPRVNLVALGLLFWVVVAVIQTFQAV